MDSIEQHIEKDKELLQDPTLSPQMRRHTADELEHLERYAKEHKKDIDHDPSAFEMYCDDHQMMSLQHLKCIVMRILKQMNVESMRTRTKITKVSHGSCGNPIFYVVL